MQNTDISDSVLRLAKFIKNDADVVQFCADNFPDKTLTVYAGDMLRRDIPSDSECPYVVLTDFQIEKEGQNIESCDYSFSLYVGVSTDKMEYVEEDGVLMPDVYDVCAKFMTLLKEIFNDPAKRPRPISKVSSRGPFPVSPSGGHWVGILDITLRIYQAIGTSYNEEL